MSMEPKGNDMADELVERLAEVDKRAGRVTFGEYEAVVRDALARLSRPSTAEAVAWRRLSAGRRSAGIYDVETYEKPNGDGWEPLFTHPIGETGGDTLGYATRLLVSLMHKHCPDRSPQWEPLPDLMGVLTQLDNLSTCLVRAPIQEHEFRADGVGVTGSDLCIDCGKERYEHDNRSTSIESDVPADGWVWRIAGFKDGWFTDDAEKAERMRLDGVFVSAVSILSAPHSQPDELKRRT